MNEQARNLVRRASDSLPFSLVLAGLERAMQRRRGVLYALTYHRVGDAASTPHLYPGLVTASADQLDAQISMLSRRFDVVGVDDVLAAATGARLPARPVLVTFDDAYADFGVVAWPVLRRHDVPVVLFTPAALPDGTHRYWWDRLHHVLAQAPDGMVLHIPSGRPLVVTAQSRPSLFTQLRETIVTTDHERALALLDEMETQVGVTPAPNGVLGWDELRRLADEGVAVANHSHTHPVLPRLSRADIDNELSQAQAALDRELSRRIPVLAYPGGYYDNASVDAARHAGFAVAFTTDEGGNDLRTADHLRLRRIHVGGLSTPGILRARMLPRRAAVR